MARDALAPSASALLMCASLIPVPSMKKMKRAAQRSDDMDQLPRQQQRVRIGTEEGPLGAEVLYYNQLSWAY